MGKSYVLSLFRDLGAVTLDSDRIVELLLKEEGVVRRVRDLLGADVVGQDGKLRKKVIAGRIFSAPGLKRGLEEIVHPLVFEKVEAFISNMKDRDRLVIVEVPLLFEGNYEGRFGKVITVFTSEAAALERLGASGISREEALSRLNTQLSIDVKKKRADYTIDNNGTKENTRQQVAAVYRLLTVEMEKCQA